MGGGVLGEKDSIRIESPVLNEIPTGANKGGGLAAGDLVLVVHVPRTGGMLAMRVGRALMGRRACMNFDCQENSDYGGRL